MRHVHLLTALCMTWLPCAAVSAAAINLPQTGQTTCFDQAGSTRTCTGTGEDGDVLIPTDVIGLKGYRELPRGI